MSHVSLLCELTIVLTFALCLLHINDVSYIWVMSLIYESCLLYMSHISYIWVMSLIHESCLLYMSVISPTLYELTHVTYTIRNVMARTLSRTLSPFWNITCFVSLYETWLYIVWVMSLPFWNITCFFQNKKSDISFSMRLTSHLYIYTRLVKFLKRPPPAKIAVGIGDGTDFSEFLAEEFRKALHDRDLKVSLLSLQVFICIYI
jgi:hypothetical protein